MWQDWIGTEAASQMIDYGYYITDLKVGGRVVPNAKVISVNTSSWNIQNWYVAGAKYDPGNQMTWLEEQLY